MIKRIADRLFKWFCHADYYADISGDLEELYHWNCEEHSTAYANRKYLADIVLLLRPTLFKRNSQNSIINMGMLNNYVKISARTLKQQKVYSGINIIGLAVGLVGFLLINEYVKFERGYDGFHYSSDEIHRISSVEVVNGLEDSKDAMAPYALGLKASTDIPEVKTYTVTKKIDENLIFRYGDKVFEELNVASADSNFLAVFPYKILRGTRESLFEQPLSIVLTESQAQKYFGEEDPMGKLIQVVSPFNYSLKVTGIIEDVPPDTHYRFDILLSDKTLAEDNDYNKWNWFNYYVYVRLVPEANLDAVTEKLAKISVEQYGEDTNNAWEVNQVQWIHLNSDYTFEPQQIGNKKSIDFLAIISIFILIIAWVNYINLSTARAVDRAKEVGLRKVIGAYRGQLMGQFLMESFMINMLSGLAAVVLAELLLKGFNNLVGVQVLDHVWNHVPFLTNLGLFVLAGTLVAGFYPALVLSGFRPIQVLKGKFRNSKGGVNLRKGLVIVQFAASLAMIAATFVVYNQVQYMRGLDLGIDKDHVITFSRPNSNAETEEEMQGFIKNFESFKEELRTFTAIESVGSTSNMPGGGASDINTTGNTITVLGMTDPVDGTTYLQWHDDQFMNALDLQMVAGRTFERSRKADSSAIIANEAFLRKMNISDPNEVIGQKLKLGSNEDADRFIIIGIVQDYSRTTLKNQIEPTLYLPSANPSKLAVEVQAGRYQDALEFIEATWAKYYGDIPFMYGFLDERFAALYAQDQRFGDVFAVFAGFTILVAMLGLFGLASFMSLQRTKEVGIRKVLGASITSIVGLFYKEFLILLSISAILAIPGIYFAMNSWLDNYAFRISFPWLAAVLALALVVVFALITVGYQTLKVAGINPSQSIRNE